MATAFPPQTATPSVSQYNFSEVIFMSAFRNSEIKMHLEWLLIPWTPQKFLKLSWNIRCDFWTNFSFRSVVCRPLHGYCLFPQTATPSVSQCNACHQAHTTRSQRIFHDNFNNFWGVQGINNHSKGIFIWEFLKADIKIAPEKLMVNDNDKKKSAHLNRDVLGYISVRFVRMSSNEFFKSSNLPKK